MFNLNQKKAKYDMKKSLLLSIIVPVYGCEKVLFELFERVTKTIDQISELEFELILIHDGDKIESWEVITNLCQLDYRVIGIKLAKNFGQHYAITAGLDNAKGDWITVMDCDLQDRPEEIKKLWEKALQGYDIVVGQRKNRKDRFLKKFGSKMFHKVFGYMTDQNSDFTQANYGIYERKVIDKVKLLNEHNRCFPLLVKWVGFSRANIEIEHDERKEGKTTYSLTKLINLALDSIISYSNKPLRLFVSSGLFLSFISTMFAGLIFIRFFFYDIPVQGWSSVIVSLFFLSGINLFGMGVLGIYISNIFTQVKNRPLYIIDSVVNR